MISVIIPVYNVEPYLYCCVQSVINQSYTDFECILVDDGSTDGSVTLCDNWGNKDNRIKVIHQQNQGVSAARNKGLELSTGEYITFIDSDDWIDVDYLLSMYETIKRDNSDVVVTGLTKEYSDYTETYIPLDSSFDLNAANTDKFVDLNSKYFFYSPYLKLFRRDVIEKHGLKFDVNYAYGEDLLFNYSYLEYVNTISCVSKSDYHYRIIGVGTLSTKFRINQFEIDYYQWQVLQSFYIRKGMWNDISKKLLYNRLWGMIYDSIFMCSKFQKRVLPYMRTVLAVPEIKLLYCYKDDFVCAKWIKTLILHRCYIIFYLFFKIGWLKK